MHDGLAQVLGYVSTKSQAVEQLLAAGRLDDARRQMQQLETAARSLYVDVREAILGLRSPISPGLGLVGAIEDYGRRFAEASGIAVIVEATLRRARHRPGAGGGSERLPDRPGGLTNVRKHAAARVDRPRSIGARPLLRIEIADDGRGFRDPAGDPGDWPHYGQAAMRERADAVRGRITGRTHRPAAARWCCRPDDVGAGAVAS